jgi:hypothetical protein
MPKRLLQRQDVDTRELPDNDVFVYDQLQKITHHLSPEVAFVWSKCDGSNGRIDIERIVSAELNIAQAKETVREALTRLTKLNLLQQ